MMNKVFLSRNMFRFVTVIHFFLGAGGFGAALACPTAGGGLGPVAGAVTGLAVGPATGAFACATAGGGELDPAATVICLAAGGGLWTRPRGWGDGVLCGTGVCTGAGPRCVWGMALVLAAVGRLVGCRCSCLSLCLLSLVSVSARTMNGSLTAAVRNSAFDRVPFWSFITRSYTFDIKYSQRCSIPNPTRYLIHGFENDSDALVWRVHILHVHALTVLLIHLHVYVNIHRLKRKLTCDHKSFSPMSM